MKRSPTQHGLSHETTIYHFTLIRKWSVPGLFWHFYYGSFIAYTVLFAVFHQFYDLISILLAVPIILCVHGVILWTYGLTRSDSAIHYKWTIRTREIWLGWFPTSAYSSFRMLRSAQLHVLWVAPCFIASLSPWASPAYILHLAFVHVWLFCPYLYAYLMLQREPAFTHIKITGRDIGCYRQ